MKVLVTGAAGFIGSHVVRALLTHGYEPRGMHLPNDRLDNLQGLDVDLVAGDITDIASVRSAMRGCSDVIHLAAVYALWLPDMQLMRRVNVQGTKNILQVAKENNVRRVVCTSSIARFGGQGNGKRATEESPFALASTRNVYAITKAEAHEVAMSAARDGQDVVIVAPTGPVGPGDIGPTPTGRLIIAASTMPVVTIPNTVSNMGDVRDIARGHVLALEKGKKGESYLLGGRDVSAIELARLSMHITGKERPIIEVPFIAASIASRGALWLAENLVKKAPLITPDSIAISRLGLEADCSKAVRELGLPQTPIETALEDAIGWFAERGYLKGSPNPLASLFA